MLIVVVLRECNFYSEGLRRATHGTPNCGHSDALQTVTLSLIRQNGASVLDEIAK